MGKVGFTPFQQLVFDKFAQEKTLRDMFYFGGGTALSVFYLAHRYSEDLDFFSNKEFDKNLVIRFVYSLASTINASVKMTKKETVLLFELQKSKDFLKLDFLTFPYPRIDKGPIYKGITVDSLKDIGANKLLVLNLNEEVKDYVDLYFILQEKYSIWDLIDAVSVKFKLRLDLISLGEDFLKVQGFQYLPKMIKPLSLNQLKDFFTKKAHQLGEKILK